MAQGQWTGRVAAAVAATLLAAWVAGGLIERHYLREGAVRAQATLALTASALEGWVHRFEVVPRLLADDAALRRIALEPRAIDRPSRLAQADRWLRERNDLLGTSEIYLIGLDGTTLAASNFDRPDSFVGQNFAYRPYFADARAGREGRFYGVGTTSGVRGYYFASPILDAGGGVAGVVAVKVGLDAVEAGWREGEAAVLVTDPEGIVFLSSEPEWLYAALAPLTAEDQARVAGSRRYADLAPRPVEVRPARVGDVSLVTVGAGPAGEAIEVSRAMPEAGWTLHVLADAGPLRAQARIAAALVLALLGLLGLGAWALRQRVLRRRERAEAQAAAQADLERLVEVRTAALTEANRAVVAEVAERRAAEAELRRTQADLVQAGKLAALGRISAALSHEINQPLAAVRTYADNATRFLERGAPDRAAGNLREIMRLVDRTAAIARHLREVARKPDAPLADVDLAEAVREALTVAGPRLDAVGASLDVDVAETVRAGPVRLQQVLVNLLTNAADAVEGLPERRVRVSAWRAGARVTLTVEDSGPGVPAAIADRVFEPFFTTKGVGAGLGLGLSISYNIVRDFGGELAVGRAEAGGASFAITLDAAPASEAAA